MSFSGGACIATPETLTGTAGELVRSKGVVCEKVVADHFDCKLGAPIRDGHSLVIAASKEWIVFQRRRS
jgi:hypothetical protein